MGDTFTKICVFFQAPIILKQLITQDKTKTTTTTTTTNDNKNNNKDMIVMLWNKINKHIYYEHTACV